MSCVEAERFVNNWNRIHKQTSRVVRTAPDDKLGWQPGEGMFTLRQLISHIPEAEVFLVRSALAGSTQRVKLDLSDSSVEDIANTFDRQHEELANEVLNLSLGQWNEDVEFYGRKMRRGVLLWGMTEHEIHHRGQLFTYLRLAGVEPPNIYS